MFKEFVSIKEAESFGIKYFGDWLKEFQCEGEWRDYEVPNIAPYIVDDKELVENLNRDYLVYRAFAEYCGGNYGLAINEYCRKGFSSFLFRQEDLDERIRIIDHEIKKFELKENIVAYRTFKYKDLLIGQGKYKIRKGDIINDKGFMGLGLVKESLLKEHNYDTIMKVFVPAGCHSIYLDLISIRPNEQEMLLQRNTRLKVLSNHSSFFNKKRAMTCVIVL